MNPKTGQAYRGVNVLALWAEAQARGYHSRYWATYRQWQAIGCQVAKGERGAPVLFFKRLTAPPIESDEEDVRDVRLVVRVTRAFNAQQICGWHDSELPQRDQAAVLADVEAFVGATQADIRTGKERACYVPIGDYIEMPSRGRFVGTPTSTPTESYYAVLFHELVHWTGAPNRLSRHSSLRYGSDSYAMEELVAELGAAFVCADLAIANEPRPDHAAYLASWLRVINGDRRAIFRAAAASAAAANYLSGFRS